MNVVLYVMDAARADHCSCYGYERETTPEIDALARDGVRFERCYAPATWTRPVAASLLSGLYPPAHGTRTREDAFAPPREPLPAAFRAAGYETVGLTTMGNVSSTTGFDRGFDAFADLYTDPDVVERRRTSTADDEELGREEGEVALPRAEDVNERFRAWFADRGDDPFFAFCWSIEPHVPYDPPEGFETFRDPDYEGPADGERDCLAALETDADLAHLEALYDEELRYNDACVGELVAFLRDRGVFEDTLLVVAGDHGDAFDEHGRLTHGHAPYEELVHVPLVASPPTGDGGGADVEPQVVDGLASLVDLYPTLLEWATGEAPAPSAPEVGGESLLPVLTGGDSPDREAVFFETQPYGGDRSFRGLRTDRHKYVDVESVGADPRSLARAARTALSKGILLDVLRNPRYYWERYRYDDSELLFDLEADPGERKNLADAEPELRAALADRLTAWLDACEGYRTTAATDEGAVDVDERTAEQLRQLGYVE